MQLASHSIIERFRHGLRAGGVMFVALLALFISIHTAGCTACRSINDDHSTARISRTALGDVQAVMAKAAARHDASSGSGSNQVAGLALADAVAAPSILLDKAAHGAAFALAGLRNSALAHRAVTVLHI